jgi:hypothetical protein
MLSEKDYTYFKKMRETQAGKTDSEWSIFPAFLIF